MVYTCMIYIITWKLICNIFNSLYFRSLIMYRIHNLAVAQNAANCKFVMNMSIWVGFSTIFSKYWQQHCLHRGLLAACPVKWQKATLCRYFQRLLLSVLGGDFKIKSWRNLNVRLQNSCLSAFETRRQWKEQVPNKWPNVPLKSGACRTGRAKDRPILSQWLPVRAETSSIRWSSAS